VAPPDADARTLPAHFRASLVASLGGAVGAPPLHVAVSDGSMAERIAERLSAVGHRAQVIPAPSAGQPPGAHVDVLVVTDPAVDLLVLPPGPIRVLWRAPEDPDADPTRSEADIVLTADPGDAAAFVGALEAWLRSVRVGIRAPTGSARKAAGWGDTYFARDLRAAFRAAGHPARVHFYDRWEDPAVGRDDVIVDLLGTYEPTSAVGAARVLWQVSHPELASAALYARYDRVFVASEPFAALMAGQIDAVPIEVLHQATDPARFHPATTGTSTEILVVANWRPGRRIMADLLPTTHQVTVHGRGWPEAELPAGIKVTTPIPNEELPAAYASAAILANDHAPGMRREGFPSNRLFDGAATGTLVISDRVDGIDALFDRGIPTYRDGPELRALVDRYLADASLRRTTAERARAAVLASHTFAHRARTILDAATPVLDRIEAPTS